MATQQELEASAGKHARAASWSWDKYLNEIRTNPSYKYKNTEWYKAGADLEKTKSASGGGGGGSPTPTPPPDSSLITLSKNVVFCAQDPAAALNSPHKMKVAFTADDAYKEWLSQSLIDQFRAQGRTLFSWGVQTQIPASQIIALRDKYHLDGAIGQGETQEEYDTAMAAGFGIIVANPNAWNEASRADANNRIAAGTLAVIGECYTNLGGPWPNQYGAGGVNISSICLGVYDGSNEQPGSGWNPSLAAYKENCSPGMWTDAGVYHAAGVNPAEWPLLA
jgi:hypothetical protein